MATSRRVIATVNHTYARQGTRPMSQPDCDLVLANLKALAGEPGWSCRGHAMTAPVSTTPCHANHTALLLGGGEARRITRGGTCHHRRPVGIERHDQLVIAGLNGAVIQR